MMIIEVKLMVIERKNYMVEYDEDNSYIEEVCEYLDKRIDEILKFFELKSLKNKRKIVIWNDLELYKKHIEQYYKYYDYMCADTNDGNINILSLEASHKTNEHSTMKLDELKRNIIHEFVHICQQDSEIEHIDNDVVWFWEALATNLGNYEDFCRIDIEVSNEEINDFKSLVNNYFVAFTIGNYMLENYSHSQILEYIRYPKVLLKDSYKILNEVRDWNKKNVVSVNHR